jgi:signal transduction histidine kinase
VTALLVFLSLFLILVRPMRRITTAMVTFRDNPEDASRIIAASTRRDEIGIAERELAVMQRDIYGFLQQKARLAALGSAVAKIQHDLRNILASAQLASDRLAKIDDPVVQRLAPRLVASIDRAVALATNTLRYGRADENPPKRKRVNARALVDEAAEATLAASAPERVITLINEIDPALEIDADPEQLFRIVLNILRNATQALEKQVTPPQIIVSGVRRARHTEIDIADNGPGVPEALRERLFQPFATSARPGGSGLGLAISRDLARAHGGDITLVSTGASGTRFRIDIPDRDDH